MLNSKKDESGRYLYEVEPGRWVSRQRVHQLRDRRKHNSRMRVIQALIRGRLKRQPCEVCGQPNAQCHHVSYEDDVIQWLCKKHHKHPKPHTLEGKELQLIPLPKIDRLPPDVELTLRDT